MTVAVENVNWVEIPADVTMAVDEVDGVVPADVTTAIETVD